MTSPSGWPADESPYHDGEIAVQERAGVRLTAERVGRRVIRDHMPDQHRELFERLPYLVVGTVDDQGRPWASMLAGQPGFVAAPAPRTLQIGALPVDGDPAAHNVRAGAPVGIVGIELHTRRRNRANGTIVAVGDRGFEVRVEQSFGNCPQYIQARAPLEAVVAGPGARRLEGPLLSPAAAALIRRADTFFIATSAPPVDGDPRRGVDVSHRGGRAGFVRVTDDRVLTIPDFAGNNAFNTLGNLALDPRAGLLFVDFATGDALTLTGAVEVAWDGPDLAAFAGAQRLLRVVVAGGVWIAGAVPLRWSEPEEARQLAATGSWPPVEPAAGCAKSGQGERICYRALCTPDCGRRRLSAPCASRDDPDHRAAPD